MPKVAVVYLARITHGIDAFAPFATSYKKFDAGYDHDLILLGKGMSKKGQHAATSALFEPAPHRIIETSEEGFDIHAYLRVAKLLDHDYICFFNTYSEIASDGWLEKMMRWAVKPDVGMVGTSASYESINDSGKLIQKVNWLVNAKGIKFDRETASQFSFCLNGNAPGWMAAFHSRYRRLRRMVGDLIRRRPRYSPALDHEFEAWWRQQTSPGGALAYYDVFPHFPNPHIRSNGFLISRKRLLNFGFTLENTKMACCHFESGPQSLSRKIQRNGLKLILAGADGAAYDVDDWPKSHTFRSRNQENLLTHDNHSRDFFNFDAKTKEQHERMTWGDYLPSPPSPHYQSLGVNFPKAPCSLDMGRKPVTSKTQAAGMLRYSVVIPTHNRPELVKEAIETVRRQSYPNWELVVFDNASSVSLAGYIQAMGDVRIVFKRSETFLPVTESWNNAINAATGNYVMLIGDDDGLTPGMFERLNELNNRFDSPDIIYASILQFFHPGVAPWQREGYVSDVRNGFFFTGRKDAFILDAHSKRKAVEGSLNIRRNFTYNSQAFVFKKEFLEKIKAGGNVFHSPFPDYYLANVAFAMAQKVVIEPEPLAIAGVSRASFGFTLFNNLEQKGAALLNSETNGDPVYQSMQKDLLPGPAYNTNYIITMEHVYRRLADWTTVRPDVGRYRKMQLLSLLSTARLDVQWLRSKAGSGVWRKLGWRERLWLAAMQFLQLLLPRLRGQRLFAKIAADLSPTAFTALVTSKNIGDYATTMQLFHALESGDVSCPHAADSMRPHKLAIPACR